MEEIGFFDKIDSGDGVTLIEWASLIPGIIPDGAIRITIEKKPEEGFDYREITVQ
jgi:tRNA threonylcarbamoyladenosine biosynthesis protein TsaE